MKNVNSLIYKLQFGTDKSLSKAQSRGHEMLSTQIFMRMHYY